MTFRYDFIWKLYEIQAKLFLDMMHWWYISCYTEEIRKIFSLPTNISKCYILLTKPILNATGRKISEFIYWSACVTHGDKKTTCWNQFLSFTMWVLGK